MGIKVSFARDLDFFLMKRDLEITGLKVKFRCFFRNELNHVGSVPWTRKNRVSVRNPKSIIRPQNFEPISKYGIQTPKFEEPPLDEFGV